MRESDLRMADQKWKLSWASAVTCTPMASPSSARVIFVGESGAPLTFVAADVEERHVRADAERDRVREHVRRSPRPMSATTPRIVGCR